MIDNLNNYLCFLELFHKKFILCLNRYFFYVPTRMDCQLYCNFIHIVFCIKTLVILYQSVFELIKDQEDHSTST